MPIPLFNLAFLQNFYGHRFNQAQADISPHDISSFAIAALINAVNLKYQNLQQSPFETHPKTAYSGIIVLLLYIFAFDAHQRLRMHVNHPRELAEFMFVRRFLGLMGYMAVATMASLIFPDPSIPAIYAVCVGISVGDIVFFLCRKVMGGWLWRKMTEEEQVNDI